MEGVPTLKDILQLGDWFVKVDRLWPPAVPEVHAGREELPIHMPPFRPVLCPSHIHQSAEASDDTASVMGGQDYRLHRRYADSGGDPEQVSQHLETLLWILQALGFIVNQDKSVFTPAQQIEFLGLVVNSVSMELSLPGEKLKQIWEKPQCSSPNHWCQPEHCLNS